MEPSAEGVAGVGGEDAVQETLLTRDATHADPRADTSGDDGDVTDVPRATDVDYNAPLLDHTFAAAPVAADVEDRDVNLNELDTRTRHALALLLVYVLPAERDLALRLVHRVAPHVRLTPRSPRPSHSEVAAAADAIPPPLRLGIVAAVVGAALETGAYDARTRWGIRRLAAVFRLPWSRVAQAERLLALTLLSKTAQGLSATGKTSALRWLKVGAGVTVGAGLLAVSGGIAAPLVAAAVGTLFTTTATLAAGVGLTTVATAVGTTAASLAGVLTVPVIATLFGITGAHVAGKKVYNRTAGVDEFTCGQVAGDLEEVPPWIIRNPETLLGQEKGGPGIAVPVATRAVSAYNILRKTRETTTQCVVMSLTYRARPSSPALALRLVDSYLESGEWVYQPPRAIPAGTSGLFTAQKKWYGVAVKGCAVYALAPESESTAATDLPKNVLVVAFSSPLVGSYTLRAALVSRTAVMDAADLSDLLSWCLALPPTTESTLGPGKLRDAHEERYRLSVVSADDAEVSLTGESDTSECGLGCCDIFESPSLRTQVAASLTDHSAAITLSLNNFTTHALTYVADHMAFGQMAEAHPLPLSVPPGTCLVSGGHNKYLRPTPVSGMVVYMVEGTTYARERGEQQTEAPSTSLLGKLRGKAGSRTRGGAVDAAEEVECYVAVWFTSKGEIGGEVFLQETPPREKDLGRLLGRLKGGEAVGEKAATPEELPVLTWRWADDKKSAIFYLRSGGETNGDATGSSASAAGAATSGAAADSPDPLRASQEALEALDVTIGVCGLTLHHDPRATTDKLPALMWAGKLGWYATFENDLQAKFGNSLGATIDRAAATTAASWSAKHGLQKGTQMALAHNPAVAASTIGGVGAGYLAVASVASAIAFPSYVLMAADMIDATYVVLKDKAKGAGRILADMLMKDRPQGQRPVTLIGVATGANSIFHAMVHLEKHGATGVVESVYLLGATIPVSSKDWARVRRVVAGRVVNVYSERDWFLSFLHRSLSTTLATVAGLSRVTAVPGIENVCVNHIVDCTAHYVQRLSDVLAFIPNYPDDRSLWRGSDALLGAGRVLPLDPTAARTCESLIPLRPAPKPPSPARAEFDVVAGSADSAFFLAAMVTNSTTAYLLVPRAAATAVHDGQWVVSPASKSVPPEHATSFCIAGRGAAWTVVYDVVPRDGVQDGVRACGCGAWCGGEGAAVCHLVLQVKLPFLTGEPVVGCEVLAGSAVPGGAAMRKGCIAADGMVADGRGERSLRYGETLPDGLPLADVAAVFNRHGGRLEVIVYNSLEASPPLQQLGTDEETTLPVVHQLTEIDTWAGEVRALKADTPGAVGVVVRNALPSHLTLCGVTLMSGEFKGDGGAMADVPSGAAAVMVACHSSMLLQRGFRGCLSYSVTATSVAMMALASPAGDGDVQAHGGLIALAEMETGGEAAADTVLERLQAGSGSVERTEGGDVYRLSWERVEGDVVFTISLDA